MGNYKQGIWIILINGEEYDKLYSESEAISKYENLLETRAEDCMESASFELVRVLRTTKINEEPVDTTGYGRVSPSIEKQ